MSTLSNLYKRLDDVRQTIKQLREEINNLAPWVDFPERNQIIGEMHLLLSEETDLLIEINDLEIYDEYFDKELDEDISRFFDEWNEERACL